MVHTDKGVRSDSLAFNSRHNTASAAAAGTAGTNVLWRWAVSGAAQRSESAIRLRGHYQAPLSRRGQRGLQPSPPLTQFHTLLGVGAQALDGHLWSAGRSGGGGGGEGQVADTHVLMLSWYTLVSDG